MVHRRTTTRRPAGRRTVPIDKLMFLRHRAKENMKFGLFAKIFIRMREPILHSRRSILQ